MGLGNKGYKLVRELAKGLAYQSALVQKAYTRPYLPRNFNRGAVRGIKHGLYAGGGYELAKDFITDGVELGNVAPFQQRPKFASRSKYQTRSRQTSSACARCEQSKQFNRNRRQSRYNYC